jgi:hypothetical protein
MVGPTSHIRKIDTITSADFCLQQQGTSFSSGGTRQKPAMSALCSPANNQE